MRQPDNAPVLRSPALPIAVGFLVFGFLIFTLSAFGLSRIKAAQVELDEAMQVQTRKIQLVQDMRQIVRARLQTMSILFLDDDPFVRDEALMEFQGHANRFIRTRRALESLPLNENEARLLEQLRALTMWATAIHTELTQKIDARDWAGASTHFLHHSLPAQRRVIDKYEEILVAFEHENLAWMQSLKSRARDEQARLLTLWLAMLGLGTAVATYATREVHDRHRQLRAQFEERRQLNQALAASREQLEATVTERTQALREAVTRLDEAQAVGQFGNWEWDIRSGKLHWSDEIYRLFGLEPQSIEPTYEAFLAAIHPEDRERLKDTVQQALTDERPYDIEHRIVHPDGSIHVVRERGRVTRNAQGQAVTMLGTVQDVTDRVEAEHQQKLAASVFQGTSDAVVILDARGHILDVDRGCLELSGFQREDLIGQPARRLTSNRQDDAFWNQVGHALQAQGFWSGEIWNQRRDGGTHPVAITINAIGSGRSPSNYVAVYRDIAKSKAYEASLWEKAHHDPLTGLPNRSLLRDRTGQAMARARRSGHCFALMVCDLDGFKAVNDRHGHGVGDAVLTEAAHRLRYALRASDTAARLGGDEFALLIEDCENDRDITLIADKLVDNLRAPYRVGSVEIDTLSVSIGIALFPRDAEDYATLLDRADEALYRVKQAGKNSYTFS